MFGVRALLVNLPDLIERTNSPLSLTSIVILGIGTLIVLGIVVFTYMYVRFNLRRQKVPESICEQAIAIAPVWAHKIKFISPESQFLEPVFVFLPDSLKIVDVSRLSSQTHTVDYGELRDVSFSVGNLPAGSAGYLMFDLRGKKFKVLTWAPSGSNSMGLRPLLPDYERDVLYNLIDAGS